LRADRFQVVVHVEEAALRESSEAGAAVLDSGVGVSAETSRRLACDASRVMMTSDPEGKAPPAGRRTRTVPVSIRRALEHRDRGCRFPGCGLRFCDAHHVRHWADGGATRLDNLVLLCRRHHRAVHEEGFGVRHSPNGAFVFSRPDGSILPYAPAPPPLPRQPIWSLTRSHAAEGIEIDAWTALSSCAGQPLDLRWAIATLRGP
jgi:hypothetical protein